jgi:hypothetical protein
MYGFWDRSQLPLEQLELESRYVYKTPDHHFAIFIASRGNLS